MQMNSSQSSSSTGPQARKRDADVFDVKRQRTGCVSSASVLGCLADSVETLVGEMGSSPSRKAAGRRNMAWAMIVDEEDLSDNKLVAATRMFASSDELAEQYSMFPATRKSVRSLWFCAELVKVMKVE